MVESVCQLTTTVQNLKKKLNKFFLGLAAIKELLNDARSLADQLNPADRSRLLNLLNEIDSLANQLADLERRGLGNTPEAHNLRRQLRDKLRELTGLTSKVLTDRVVEDFSDITTPLKQFVEAVYTPQGTAGREENFHQKASNLQHHATSCTNTANLVAKCGPCKNKKTVEGLVEAATKVNHLTPQVINAGKIRLHNSSQDVDTHFDNLRREYADALTRLRDFVDDAIDTGDFVRASENAMRRYTNHCEDSIVQNQPQQMVDNTSQIARLGNRVLMAAKNEADNSEEPVFISRVNNAASQLHSGKSSSFYLFMSTLPYFLSWGFIVLSSEWGQVSCFC